MLFSVEVSNKDYFVKMRDYCFFYQFDQHDNV